VVSGSVVPPSDSSITMLASPNVCSPSICGLTFESMTGSLIRDTWRLEPVHLAQALAEVGAGGDLRATVGA
jgi:hypothetical protein